jgi:hypothetical protein
LEIFKEIVEKENYRNSFLKRRYETDQKEKHEGEASRWGTNKI